VSIRRRLSGIVVVLAFAGGALAVTTHQSGASSTHHLACSTCPRPIEQPR
jgi:hypothetical protein